MSSQDGNNDVPNLEYVSCVVLDQLMELDRKAQELTTKLRDNMKEFQTIQWMRMSLLKNRSQFMYKQFIETCFSPIMDPEEEFIM